MQLFLLKFVCVCVVSGLMFFTISKSYHFQEDKDFVILADKVGNPAIMTTFRVGPNGHGSKDPNYCSVGGDKLYTPWNTSVFTEAKAGDVLRRYHYTTSYQVLGKTILQDCFEMFMPVKIVSLYPDMNYWPFRKDDLDKNDPDYDRISKLTKSQRQ